MIDLGDIDPALHDGIAALASQMTHHGTARDAPVREIFGLLGDRWTTLILLVLKVGTWRHAELRRILGRLGAEGKISQRVLTSKLRALERDGLVKRIATDHVPPRVSYRLTTLGDSLEAEAERLIAWVQANRSTIESARTDFVSRCED